MSIKLKVPAKPAAEFVSHGNFSVELKPKSVISVKDRRFADWLVTEYALAEVGGEENSQPAGGDQQSEETAGGNE